VREQAGEPYQQDRLSQDRLPVDPFPCRIAGLGEKEVSW